METVNDRASVPATNRSSSRVAERGPLGRLGRWRIVAVGLAGAAAVSAVALSEGWLAIADLVPALFLLPCAAMMYVCMKGMHESQQTTSSQAATAVETPEAAAAEPSIAESSGGGRAADLVNQHN